MEEIIVTSPTKVKCRNANDDGWNEVYIDDAEFHATMNNGVSQITFGVCNQNVYVNSDNPEFQGVIYQDQSLVSLQPNSLITKEYSDNQKGVLENKTTAELLAIENPEIGKLYFNLDNNLDCYWNGLDWKKIVSENL